MHITTIVKNTSRPLFRWLLGLSSLLLLLTSGLSSCERPTTSEVEPGNTSTSSPDEANEVDKAEVQDPIGPDGLRRLDATLEVTFEEGVEPKEVLDLGPPGSVILFTSAMRGYIEPCGCTLDVLLGGIDRVSGFVRSMKGLSDGAIMLDAGNMLFEEPRISEQDVPQAILKAELLLSGHQAMGTVSTTPGPLDLSLGLSKYKELVKRFDIPVTVANLTEKDVGPLGEARRLVEVERSGGPVKVGITAVVDPETMGDFYDLEASDPVVAAGEQARALREEGAQVLIVVAQGDLAFARALATEIPEADFVIVGQDPAKTDEVIFEGDTAILQGYSQGRHVGVMKVYPSESGQPFMNARIGTREEVARLDRRIAYIDEALNQVPPAAASEESEFVTRKREELDRLIRERLELSGAGVELPSEGSAFAYFSVPMKPGYPLDSALYQRKNQYTEGLEALYAELAPKVPEPPEGQASFVGSEACMSCHEESHDFWMETPHSHALKTLVDKGKEHDPDCLSCHVVGYGEPGGSIVGAIGDLTDVGCESCHGPGSLHVEDTDLVDVEGGVWLKVGNDVCITCHDPENSPRFDYERYIPMVLGEGHDAK